jgi:hypothetical protein
MPRDEFARLERRWRERPLFLPRRRRLARWPLLLALLAGAGTLASALVDRGQLAALALRLEAAFGRDAIADPIPAPPTPTAAATAAARDGRTPPAAADR